MTKNRVGIIVLGDIGHSPRMLYHARSLSEEGCDVTIIGYNESRPDNQLIEDVEIRSLKQPPNFSGIANFIVKAFWNFFTLLWALFFERRFDVILVQNPPGIPSLVACYLYCLVTRCKFLIDWHNYTFTILSMNTGKNHFLVKVARWYEGVFGKLSNGNICVTNMMREDLFNRWGIIATTLHDKPMRVTLPNLDERINFFQKLSLVESQFKKLCASEDCGLLVSSTSWTPDEDFTILLESLKIYDESDESLPNLLCVITGKGPLKSRYECLIASFAWKKVTIVTPWLEAEDYPILLSCADLGVCLHKSSSGLDLPMKIVDMFGSGLPVCAYDYPCLSELLRDNVNGFTFKSSDELGSQIISWFTDFPNVHSKRREFQEEIAKFNSVCWCENWNKNVSKFFITSRNS